ALYGGSGWPRLFRGRGGIRPGGHGSGESDGVGGIASRAELGPAGCGQSGPGRRVGRRRRFGFGGGIGERIRRLLLHLLVMLGKGLLLLVTGPKEHQSQQQDPCHKAISVQVILLRMMYALAGRRRGGWDRVPTALAKGLATDDAIGGEQGTHAHAAGFNSLDGILRAGGVEPAAALEKGKVQCLIAADGENCQAFEQEHIRLALPEPRRATSYPLRPSIRRAGIWKRCWTHRIPPRRPPRRSGARPESICARCVGWSFACRRCRLFSG